MKFFTQKFSKDETPKQNASAPPPATNDNTPRQESRVGLSVDIENLVKLFGLNNYTNNLVDVAVKELLQNAFDSVRGATAAKQISASQAQIDIRLNPETRCLSVADNGLGMSPETVKDVFLKIGASLKENLAPENRSGGFGLAKLAFLFLGDRIRLKTRRDGTETTLQTNGVELLQGQAKLTSAPTNRANGSFIEILFPEKIESLSGKIIPILFPQKWQDIATLKQPLIGSVTVTAQTGDKKPETLPLGFHHNHKAHPLSGIIRTPWGTATLYMTKESLSTPSPQSAVLSAGIFQFKPLFSGVKNGFVFDIRPSVPPDHKLYPFNKQRESWNQSIQTDVAGLQKIVEMLEEFRKHEKACRAFHNAKILTRRHETGKTLYACADLKTTFLQPHPLAKEKTPYFSFINDTITFKNEVLFEQTNNGYSLRAGLEKTLYDSFRLKLETTKPVLHTNLNIDIIAETAQTLRTTPHAVVQALGEIGYLAHDYFSKIIQVPGYKNKNWPDPVFGLSIDKGYYGVNVIIPSPGSYLNPAALIGQSPAAWAHGWLHTMLHETTHWGERGHNDSFTTKMGHLYGLIEDANPGLYTETLSKLTQFTTKNEKLFKTMFDLLMDKNTTPGETPLNPTMMLKITPAAPAP